tara:strand:+ start:2641 stop:3441 length:801 start_codon:yes stop_codon:yes gene_type:complete
MTHIRPQKTIAAFLLTDGGGAKLSKLSTLPLCSVLLAVSLLTDAHSVSKCSQQQIADGLGIGLRTVKNTFKELLALGILRKLSRGAYGVTSYDNLELRCNHCTFSIDKCNHCTFGKDKCNHCTFGALDSEKSEEYTIIKDYPVSGSQVISNDDNRQQKIERLEKIVCDNLGTAVWAQSMNWADLMNRAEWDLDTVTDAIISYKDKVIGAGQRHRFSRLYTFVKTEAESKRARRPLRPNYTPQDVEDEGQRITEGTMGELLERLKNV